MEEKKANEIINNKELISNTKHPYKFSNILSPKGKYTDLYIKKIKRKSAQISPNSRSITNNTL
jgi:hypothetical protein